MEIYRFSSGIELSPEKIAELERAVGGKVIYECHLEEISFGDKKELIRGDAYNYAIRKREIISTKDEDFFKNTELELMPFEVEPTNHNLANLSS